MQVWVTEGSRGGGEDNNYSQWVIGIFSTKKKARAAVAAAKAAKALKRQKVEKFYLAVPNSYSLADRLAGWDEDEKVFYSVTEFGVDVRSKRRYRVRE
jgi:hypothetical protein